jgi:hypothetical protein
MRIDDTARNAAPAPGLRLKVWILAGALVGHNVCTSQSLPAGSQSTARIVDSRIETLPEAQANGDVDARFHANGGSSGDIVVLTIRKTAQTRQTRIVITIQAGLFLRNMSGGQGLLIAALRGRAVNSHTYTPSSRIVLSDATPVDYVIEAYCAEHTKDNPAETDRLVLESSGTDPVETCIFRKAGPNKLSVSATQAAVWIHRSRLNFDAVRKKISLTRDDWERATTVVQECRMPESGIGVRIAPASGDGK